MAMTVKELISPELQPGFLVDQTQLVRRLMPEKERKVREMSGRKAMLAFRGEQDNFKIYC